LIITMFSVIGQEDEISEKEDYCQPLNFEQKGG